MTTSMGAGNGPLIASTEAARILGWSVGRVNTYRKRGLLPKPVQYLGANETRPVWRREDIVGHSVGVALGVTVEDGELLPGYRTPRGLAAFRHTYNIPAGERIGTALVAQGILSGEQAAWLDQQLKEAE